MTRNASSATERTIPADTASGTEVVQTVDLFGDARG
jgi:hypothetical protein